MFKKLIAVLTAIFYRISWSIHSENFEYYIDYISEVNKKPLNENRSYYVDLVLEHYSIIGFVDELIPYKTYRIHSKKYGSMNCISKSSLKQWFRNLEDKLKEDCGL